MAWFHWVLKITHIACTSLLKFLLAFKTFTWNNSNCWCLALTTKPFFPPDSLEVKGHRQDETDFLRRKHSARTVVTLLWYDWICEGSEGDVHWQKDQEWWTDLVSSSETEIRGRLQKCCWEYLQTLRVNCLESVFLTGNYDVHIINI